MRYRHSSSAWKTSGGHLYTGEVILLCTCKNGVNHPLTLASPCLLALLHPHMMLRCCSQNTCPKVGDGVCLEKAPETRPEFGKHASGSGSQT